jgi:hypothetical protein
MFHNTIKNIVVNTPFLTPIDPSKEDPIWVICDTSTLGVGAYYGQGPSWRKCQPAGFHLRKFMETQRNYRTHEQELLAILKALMSWEDKLIGRKITIVTDHKSLEFFKTQGQLSCCQSRWWEYLSRFNYDIHYVKGKTNVITDIFSRFYHNCDDNPVSPFEYISAQSMSGP